MTVIIDPTTPQTSRLLWRGAVNKQRKTKSMTRKSKSFRPRCITLKISTEWTPDQARAVLEVVEDLRSVLIAHCREKLRSEFHELAEEVLLACMQPELPF